MTVKCITVKYRNFKTVHENTSYFILTPWKKLQKQKQKYAFCSNNISSTKIFF